MAESNQVKSSAEVYGLTLVAVAIAGLLRWLFDPFLGDHLPFVTFFIGVAAAAWLGGLRPALSATGLGFGVAWYFFAPPRHSWDLPSAPHMFGLGMYLIVCLALSVFGEAMHIARRHTEREQLKRLAERERFQLAAEAVNGIIYEYDITTGHVERQRGLYEVLGYRADEVPPTAAWWWEQIHPDDHEPLQKRLLEFAGNSLTSVYRVRHQDGRWLHVEDRAVLLRGDDGQLLKMIGCTVDVTARKRADEQLQYSEQLHRIAFDASPTGMMYVGADGRFTKVNPAMCEIAGYTAEELVGMKVSDLTHPDDRARDAEILAPFLRGDTPAYETDKRYLRKDGGVRWVAITAGMVTDTKGRPLHTVGVARDITDRKRVEQALADRTELLNGVLEGTTDVIFVKDLSGRCLMANTACAAVLGSTPDQVVGKTTEELCPPDLAAAVRRHDEAVIASGSPVQLEESFLVAGEPRVFLTLKAPLRDGGGRVVGVLGISRDITDRKRAEEERRLLASIVENSRDFIGISDTKGNPVYGNRAAMDLVGIEDLEQVRRSKIVDYFVPEQRQFVVDVVLPAVVKDGRWCGELLMQHFVTGATIPVWYDLFRVDDPVTGQPINFATVTRDLTERKREEERLRQSEARFRAGIEAVSNIVWTNDAQGQMAGEQAAWGKFTGQNQESYQGYGWSLALHPDDAQPTIDAWNEAVAGKKPFEFEHRILRADGQWRLCSIRAVPVLNDRGEISEWVGVHTDITERKEAEAALRVSEARLGGILRRSPAGIVQTDAAGCMTLVNPRWCEMLGYDEAELLGRSIIEVTHPSFVAATATAVGRLAAGGPDFQIEKDYCRKDDSVLRVQSNVAAIRSPAGEFLGLIAVVLDISERLRTEDELRRLAATLSEVDRRKDEFLATLAHELRNPLAPIRNGLQIMKLAHVDAGTVEKSRSMMERQVDQMTRLIDDLMDISRINQGKLQLQTTRMPLADAVRNAVETSRPLIDVQGHELVVDVPPQPIYVDGDLTRLSQVFANLLNNSAKYTDRGGRIRLAVEQQGSDAVVSIADNGVGIPANMLTRVFDMFAQIDGSLEKSQGGLGIGLNIVKRLVEMHGGSITAESGGPGRGSTFTVRLPGALSVTDKRSDDQSTDEKATPAPRRRILVVDDNRDGASSLVMLLKIMGHETQTAHDGLEAVAVAETFKPDVILMDIGMPKLNGYDACRRIREQPWGRNVVIVAQTGWGQEEDRQKSKDAGFNGHLVKPVEHVALMKLLANS